MVDWTPGYTRAELDGAQDRYGLRFPPDLVALLLDRHPAGGYAWNTEDPRIRDKLAWPLEMLTGDVENGLWWPDWGERPDTVGERAEIVRQAVASAPRLIPLYGHRFLPETPSEAGNPVFSMYGFDTIYYGFDLDAYLRIEFGGPAGAPVDPAERYIPFWSDLAEAA